jgi:D-isomer specific 2-hydroxyacid dehydrogenase, catalytic domain
MERGAAHRSRSRTGGPIRPVGPAMKAVLHAYCASPGLRQRVAALDFPTVMVEEADKNKFLREMGDAEILLHVLEPVTAAVIAATPGLKLIQKIGIGVNTIDLDAARHRGIAVCNMPETNTRPVAEMTLLLTLATLRRLAQLDDLTRAGKCWDLKPEMSDASSRDARSAWSALARSPGACCGAFCSRSDVVSTHSMSCQASLCEAHQNP